jgi:hypothetical protein
MKKILYLILAGFFLCFSSCSDECDQGNPTIRLVNSGSAKADIQIKTSGGNTININNIQIGESSEKRTFAPGDIEFTIAIQGVNEPIVYNLKVFYCMDYIVTVNQDNTVSGASSERD